VPLILSWIFFVKDITGRRYSVTSVALLSIRAVLFVRRSWEKLMMVIICSV